ncbi:MAG: IclR family transcriptional regulator [Rhodobacteraceae bacterium]|nr:IclR family transcriptional regulator [Paracoccaceae bacterium]
MTDQVRKEKGEYLPPNLRLLAIIEEVGRAGIPVSPTAISEAVGLPVPTVHRLLATAEEEGFLQRDVDGRSFGPGQRLRRLSGNILSSQRIRTERLLVLRELADEVGETCNLATPGRYGMVYIDRVETHWPLRIQLPVGTQVPFHCTASGKMYLSSLRSDKLSRVLKWLALEPKTDHTITDEADLRKELRETHKRQFSSDNQEFMEGMSAIAVPISDSEGRLLSTLSIHAPSQRHDLSSLINHYEPLRKAADRIEALCVD